MWQLYLITVIPRIIPFTFGESPIFAGEAAQVTCLVSAGDPPLDISWHFDGISDIGITMTKVGRKASTLLIESAGIQHRGNYTCIAKNAAGFVAYTTPLNIHGNLQFPLIPVKHNFILPYYTLCSYSYFSVLSFCFWNWIPSRFILLLLLFSQCNYYLSSFSILCILFLVDYFSIISSWIIYYNFTKFSLFWNILFFFCPFWI